MLNRIHIKQKRLKVCVPYSSHVLFAMISRSKVEWRLTLAYTFLFGLLRTSFALPQDCGAPLTNPSGILEHSSDVTKGSQDKCWQITVDSDKYVLLTADSFNINTTIPCKDWLKVSNSKEGLSSATPLCGNISDFHIESLENTLYVHLKTDDSDTFKGYKLKWSSMSKEKIIAESEDLISICPQLKDDGYCEDFPTAMDWSCKKTCEKKKATQVINRPKRECGLKYNANPLTASNKVVKGAYAPSHKYPWQVGLRYPQFSKHYFCGGSIINNDYILTAAHCFWETRDKDCEPTLKETTLQIGLADSDQRDPFDGGFIVYADEVIIHPQWNCTHHFYDFALLKLEQSLVFEDHDYIAPVCLPENDEKTYEGMIATLSGWGKSDDREHEDILKEGSVKIQDVLCDGYQADIIDTSMLCAINHEEGHDSCNGDSGGPLTVEEDGRMVQVGVVSFGRGCGVRFTPGIYGRVSKVLDWIKDPTATDSEFRLLTFKTSWMDMFSDPELAEAMKNEV